MRKDKRYVKTKIKEYATIVFGVFLMSIAYGMFIDPNGLVVGGVGGIATIVRDATGFDSWIFILILNVVLLIAALIFVGKEFFLKTILGSILFPLFIAIVNKVFEVLDKIGYLPRLTNITDFSEAGGYLVIVIFSSVLMGLGVGLALKNNASTGGTDILQEISLKWFKLPYSASLFLFDGVIVLAASIYFKSILVILYGILFIYLSGYVMDGVVFSGFNVRAVNIVTKKPEEVKKIIFDKIERGVTELYSRGGFTMNDSVMITCVMSTKEFYMIRTQIHKLDPSAFIYVTRAIEVHGEGFSYPTKEEKGKKE